MTRSLCAQVLDGDELRTVRIGPERYRPWRVAIGWAVAIAAVVVVALFAGLLEQGPPAAP